jgi:hypothetical protein
MRRLLAGLLLGSVALALPQHALAYDYVQPVVPEQFLAGAPAPAATGPAVDAAYAPGVANPQSEPVSPSYVPRNPWDNGDSGCSLADWNVC